jgi:hypothetical protein
MRRGPRTKEQTSDFQMAKWIPNNIIPELSSAPPSRKQRDGLIWGTLGLVRGSRGLGSRTLITEGSHLEASRVPRVVAGGLVSRISTLGGAVRGRVGLEAWELLASYDNPCD